MHLQLHVHLAQILDEVVGEGIVIVYDQNHIAWGANVAPTMPVTKLKR
jgi:hypothetical protein